MATNSVLRRALHSVHLTAHEENLLFGSRNVIVHLATPLVTRMGITERWNEPMQFLDLACGTGIVTDIVQKRVLSETLSQSKFRATDASEVMLGMTKKRVELEGWTNVETEVMDAKVCSMVYDDDCQSLTYHIAGYEVSRCVVHTRRRRFSFAYHSRTRSGRQRYA